jgi:iron complex outermembrane receptor protein
MKSWIVRGSAAFCFLAPFAVQVQAQTPTPSDDDIDEEIIVTAQKRATSLQDVPFSVAAMTAENLQESGATNIVDVARNVPGLYISDLGPGQSQVAIRGISAGQVVRDQPGAKESVGIYLDESPISVALFTPDLDLYDLDRIEVLRGPQGTLFGAGSSSGTVRYITAQPDVGAFGASFDLTGETVAGGDIGGSLRAAVNVPLGEKAAMRAVGYHSELAGFIDSVYPGRDPIEDVNSGQRTGGRLAFRFEVGDNFVITPRVVYQKLETDGYPRFDIYSILGNNFTTTEPRVDIGDREQVTQIDEGLTDDFMMGDLKLEANFGESLGFTSVTTYMDRQVLVLRDASQLTGSVTKDIGGTDAQARFNSPLVDETDLQVFSQEFRLASTGEGPFQWLAGVFYQEMERDYGQTLPTPGYDAFIGAPSSVAFAPADTPFYSRISYEFEQLAAFGEATYRFNPKWALTGGLRYYDFEESRLLTFTGFFVDPNFFIDEPGSTSSDGISPRVILSYDASDNVQWNAQMSRGFRLGGINDPLNLALCTPADEALFGGNPGFDDEKTTNYEIGAKTRLADGRVTLNAAVFFTDIDGLQVVADAGSCSSRIILNAQAESKGVEFELSARPDENWDFALSGTYAKATITEDYRANTPLAGVREGNRLPTSPEFQAAFSAGYTFPFSDSLESFARLTVQHVGSSYTQLADQEAGFGLIHAPPNTDGSARLIQMGGVPFASMQVRFPAELPSYNLGNVRWGVRSDKWEAAIFVNNLWNERAYLSLDRERGRSARVGYLTNPPRTVGVNFNMSF